MDGSFLISKKMHFQQNEFTDFHIKICGFFTSKFADFFEDKKREKQRININVMKMIFSYNLAQIAS